MLSALRLLSLTLQLQTGLVDAPALAAHARAISQRTGDRIPAVAIWAIAKQETGTGLHPWALGPGIIRTDSLGHEYRICRERGRMQLSPCQNYTHLDRRCTTRAISTDYALNIHCGILWYDYKLRLCNGIQACAIESYNGSGPRARAYLKRCLEYIGQIHLQELHSSIHATQELAPLHPAAGQRSRSGITPRDGTTVRSTPAAQSPEPLPPPAPAAHSTPFRGD